MSHMFDNLYSRIVAWLKVILPLAALGIMSTVFIFARAPDVERAIPYAPVSETFSGDERVGEPNYMGMTEDGSSITLVARVIRPSATDPDVMEGENLSAELRTQSGSEVDIVSDTGTINQANKRALLAGSVGITTSNGYVVTTERLISHLDETHVETEDTVHATGPIGTLVAGRMILSAANGQGYVLDFNGGVELVYQPGK
ncbi:MAG: LPS export ABC transporter periplasmic protein LptC [Pseudomonadota bacterium]